MSEITKARLNAKIELNAKEKDLYIKLDGKFKKVSLEDFKIDDTNKNILQLSSNGNLFKVDRKSVVYEGSSVEDLCNKIKDYENLIKKCESLLDGRLRDIGFELENYDLLKLIELLLTLGIIKDIKDIPKDIFTKPHMISDGKIIVDIKEFRKYT